MPATRTSPIRVLLLDDKPDPFRAIPTQRAPLRASILPTGNLGSRIEVFWVSNPEQARVLLNSLERLFMATPDVLEVIPFPPEVLIFDYAQTQRDNSHIRSSDDPSNPFPLLKNAIAEFIPGIEFEIREDGGIFEPPPQVGGPGSDRFGCFMGGTLARIFHGHPCASVPTTAHGPTSDPNVGFFEWFNEQYFQGGFDHKQRRTLNWQIIMNAAMPLFRKNFITLAKHGEIEAFPSSLTELARFKTDPTDVDLHLGFRSRFGVRRIPIASVFCDELASLREEVAAFTNDLVSACVVRQNAYRPRLCASHVNSAAEAAEDYDNLSVTEISIDRYTLSNVVSAVLQGRRQSNDVQLLELCTRLSLDPVHVLAEVRRVEPQPNAKALPLLNERTDPRLAILFLMVRLSQRSQCDDTDSISLMNVLTDDEIVDGVADRARLVELMGEIKARRLLENHRIPFLDGEGTFPIPLTRDLDFSVLWTAIDPLPRSILTFENRSKSFGRDVTYLTNAIKRNCDGLIVSNVLNSAREGKVLNEGGLFPGEGQLLRGYAAEIGFSNAHWPAWLRRAI